MAAPNKMNKKRIVILFGLTGLLLLAIIGRLGWIQIVDAERYKNLAIEQQTKDTAIPAKRGIIYDRNFKELAISAPTNTVWVRPAELKQKKGDVDAIATTLSAILVMDKQEIIALLTKDSTLVKISKYIEKKEADLIRQEKLPGISIAEDIKRYYPFGSFASHILGHTTDDNEGLAGIEQEYNKYLSGVAGRIIKNTDVKGRSLPYGTEKYYEEENGLNVVLTIDEVIQHFMEKSMETAYNNTGAKRVMAIVMEPSTGGILAMGVYPDYDPNNARMPLLQKDIDAYSALTSAAIKSEYWNKMWRNPLISDTYEPGSTFKLITTSIALEEGVSNPYENFTCTGYLQVADRLLRCDSYRNPHGAETLTQAVQNSCNPVFVILGQRIGVEKFYDYLDTFGFKNKTGVDYPGEGEAILYPKNNVGPVELATISYGQGGISVTPIQLITAISAIANGGNLMQPRLVSKLVDDDGKAIYNYEPKVVRQAISKQTSDELKVIMESVVSEGSGGKALIPGYRVGGKTGTADKVIDGRYVIGKVYGSFAGIAPSEDPQIAVLFIVDEPEGVHYGSQTAAPYVKTFLEETLRYLKIKPSYTEKEIQEIEKDAGTVPEVTGMSITEAAISLKNAGFGYTILPAEGEEIFTVMDQYPKSGTKAQKTNTVYLYRE